MDINFLNSVQMADATYCWIIGNDDLPEKAALKTILDIIKMKEFDLLVTPFNMYGTDEVYRGTVQLFEESEIERVYQVSFGNGIGKNVLSDAKQNGAFFTFLSNVIFKRDGWMKNISKFQDKMDTIFIQMYMNFQMMFDGAVYIYEPCYIIRNYLDDDTNATIKRKMDILCGLNGVIDYFFDSTERDMLKELIVDPYLEGDLWALDLGEDYNNALRMVDTPKNRLYKKFFLEEKLYSEKLGNCNVVVYGAGKKGRDAAARLRKNGYNNIILAVTDLKTTDSAEHICKIDDVLLQDERRENIYIVANHFDVVKMTSYLMEKGVSSIYLIN